MFHGKFHYKSPFSIGHIGHIGQNLPGASSSSIKGVSKESFDTSALDADLGEIPGIFLVK